MIGVLFGLTLAFLANDTWTAHDRAVRAVLQEADAIRNLLVLGEGLDPAERALWQAAIRAYAAAAIAEWPLLARCLSDAAVGRCSDRLLTLAAAPAAARALGGTVQQMALQQVSAIKASRDLRIGLSQTHVNPLKGLGMGFLGFLTLLTVAVVHAGNAEAALVAMVLFGLAAAPTSAIVLIHGNPFQRPSAVSPGAIAEALGDEG